MRVPEAFRVVEKAAAAPRKSAWKPTPRDELIHQWVRFDGKSQHWVAMSLNISQGTVSRVVQRYERWLAHTEPREAGQLDHDERLRAQRWLTYERNERILASCLRIAGEMEGFIDVSKSTIRREGLAGAESDVQTQHATLDRSGIAARFLRLAFRVNMEQLKLVEMEPLEALPPLTEDEVDDVAAEEVRVPVVARSATTAGDAAGGFASLDPSHPVPSHPITVKENYDERCNGAHNAHERIMEESATSADTTDTYNANGRPKKTAADARMVGGAVGNALCGIPEQPAKPSSPPKRPTRVFHGGMPSAYGKPTNRLTAAVADGADEAEGRRRATDETPIKHGSG